MVEELKKADAEVRQHEMAHVAAGGGLIASGATFSYQKGPDGNNYAVAGEVRIDAAPVPGDPEATIQKMNQVKAAALAPASPSSQDQKVAANASAHTAKAMAELAILRAAQETKTTEAGLTAQPKSDLPYIEISELPEDTDPTFQTWA
ncbi:MAG: hypothetical protein MI747_09625 [Desulfobacterales bacterium]|nr:hypothetical protein [Desulfobacterales bacterium]